MSAAVAELALMVGEILLILGSFTISVPAIYLKKRFILAIYETPDKMSGLPGVDQLF